MKFKLMATTIAFMQTLFGWNKVPVVDGQLSLSEDEDKQLSDKLGPKTAKEAVEAINKEIAQLAKNDQENEDLKKANEELEKVKAEVQEMLNATNLSEEEKEKIVKGQGENAGDLTAQLQAIKAAQKKQDALLAKLINDPEGDAPEEVIKNNAKNMKHSATHLFGSGQEYDAFESRPWNQRLRDGSPKATDFNSGSAIPLLEKDAEHFVRQNPEAIESLFNDLVDLPSEWSRREGVLDIISSAAIIPGEIVQGRKKGWAPKNKFKIAPESGRVFRKKIDITFDGYELQEIENTWMRSYNKEGSHPWKMSFVGFLLSELMKQQKLDSRIAQIKGIFAQTPEGDGLAGDNLHSQDGLLYFYWLKRDVEKKYRPFSSALGEPTPSNIVDYVREMIESLPEEDRRTQGLELELSYQLLQWYKDKAGLIYSLAYADDQGKQKYNKNHPIDYENIKFQPLLDFAGTKFMAITQSKNVEVMNYKSSEKSSFTITKDKRDINIFADFREGIRLKYVGTKLADGEPKTFEKQVVWSNDVPVFDPTMKVPVFDDKTGIVNYHYNNMKVDEGFVTDIVQFSGVPTGQVLKITGNTSLAGQKFIKNNANNTLSADFDLQSGGTLVLYATAEGKVKELSRTAAPAPESASGETFEGDTVDANLGNEFYYAGAASGNLTEILNGVDGKVIKIYGTDTATVNLTVSDVAGNIDVTADAVLATKADFIELVRVDGVWTEVSRTIA